MQHVYSLLLVDDEEADRLLLTRRLEQAEYVITGAENGSAAIDIMRLERFDLVLLDMNMPVMDGLTTLDAIKSDPILRKTPVMMLTANHTREQVIHCLTLGAADYLIKPVNPIELRQRVRRCLEHNLARIEPTMRVESTDLSGAGVLIVDDEPLNLMLLERRLSQAGYRALSALGGREALEALENEAVDAVLLDINMPEVNGMEVLSSIRANEKWKTLPVLMLSADGQQETIDQCYQLGANDFLVKPYQTHDLQLRLAVALAIGRIKLGSPEPLKTQ